MKEKKNWMLIGIVIMIMGGWIGSVWSAELKVGCVDIQRAVNESNAGKEAKKALGKEIEKFQRQIGDKQNELQTMKESLEKQGPMLTPEVRATKEKDYQNRLREFQRWGEDNQNELNQKRGEMERVIAIALQKVIKKLGEDEGYTLILEKNENIVFHASKSIDITDRVIKIYDVQKK